MANDEEKTKEQLSYEIAYLRLLNAELEEKHHQTEDVLKVVTEQYRRIISVLSDYVFSVHIIDGNPVKTVHGPGCKTITGYQPDEFTDNTYLWIQMVHDDDKPTVLKNVANILSGLEAPPFTHRIVRKDGAVRWVRNTPVCQYDDRGRLLAYDGLIQDVTEKKETEEALRRSEEKYRTVADFTYDWEYWRGTDGAYIYVSPSCERLTGYKPQEFLADPHLMVKITHPEDRELVKDHLRKFSEEGRDVSHMDFRIISKAGVERWMSHVCQPVYREDGTWLGRRGSNRDITKRKLLEDKLRSMTLCDELTGLYNRRGFITLGEQQLKIASRIGKKVSLFFTDIDGMKSINDTCGHHEGDAALRDTALTLRHAFRESDIVARIGGDEFVLLAIETDDDTATVLRRRLTERLDHFNSNSNRPYRLSLSVGVAHFDPEHPCSLDDLMTDADARMYAEKQMKHTSIPT
jgi:diguanylate cyclase (GGDEF)-like protein/PAS domain S-box-containing protein